MTIATKDLKNLLPLLKSVLGNIETRPMTTYLGIKTTADSIVFYTSGRDKVKTSLKVANPDQGIDICVNANLFLGLLDKTTTENIELSKEPNQGNLLFKGNGTYTIEKIVSETGDRTYDDITTDNLTNSIGELTKDIIKKIMDNNSFALNKIQEKDRGAGSLSTENYHINTDKTVTSDGSVISNSTLASGLSSNLSLDPITMASLEIICKDENVKVYQVGNDNLFVGKNTILSSPVVENASTFPLEELVGQMKDELYDKEVTVDKSALISAIDRISLFNTTNEALLLTFGNNAMEVSIKGEKESLVAVGDGEGFIFSADSDKLLNSVKALNTNSAKFKFNKSTPEVLRLDGDNFIIVVAAKD